MGESTNNNGGDHDLSNRFPLDNKIRCEIDECPFFDKSRSQILRFVHGGRGDLPVCLETPEDEKHRIFELVRSFRVAAGGIIVSGAIHCIDEAYFGNIKPTSSKT